MKSICIKTNNKKIVNYLLDELKNINMDEVYYSYKKFKIYENIIIHYKGKTPKLFLKEMSYILANLVIDLYEDKFISKLISSEYFYFDKAERKEISKITFEDLYDFEEAEISRIQSFDLIANHFYGYLSENHNLFLTGFLTFRLKNYIDILNKQIDKSVNKFLVQKEYNEFISLLKIYVSSEISKTDIVHLVYSNTSPILFDKDKQLIKLNDDMIKAKYLSDITFSSNDYILNTLLTLLPQKIYVHLIDNQIDDFITTLKLIFENRIVYCNDCSICKIYKNKKNHILI